MDRKDKEQVKNSILDALIACKYDAGGGSFQVTQVAAKAGMSTRTLHRYFPDKELMTFMAAIRFLDSRYGELEETYNARLAEGDTGLDRLACLLSIQKEYYQTDAVTAIMMVSASVNYIHGKIDRNFPGNPVDSSFTRLVMCCVEMGVRDGSMRAGLDPTVTSLLICASYQGMMQRLAFAFKTDCSEAEKGRRLKAFDAYMEMLKDYLCA